MRRAVTIEMTTYHPHIPVLKDASLELLITEPNGIYVDATLGGGGHSLAILDRIGEEGILYSIDQDREALAAACERIGNDPRFHPVEGNFGYLSTLLPPRIHQQIDGILLDLGVSTHQIREGERGFSFQQDGPLDMRMSSMTGLTASEVVNNYPYEVLRDIIFHYGEEKRSRQIARSIIENRPLETTADLRRAVEQVVSGPKRVKSLARVFQGIRIEVNRELDMLKSALEQSLELLKPGGRMVVISYHSLEDRIVKTFFRTGNHEGRLEKDFYGHVIRPVEPLNRKPVIPSPEETTRNPAARSAKLRAARKIAGG